jgi:hypothetical protein
MSSNHDMRILAIDLGKRSGVFCDYSVPSGQAAYGTVKMAAAALHDVLLERVAPPSLDLTDLTFPVHLCALCALYGSFLF